MAACMVIELVAIALLAHLMAKNIPLAFYSTNSVGAALSLNPWPPGESLFCIHIPDSTG